MVSMEKKKLLWKHDEYHFIKVEKSKEFFKTRFFETAKIHNTGCIIHPQKFDSKLIEICYSPS